MLRNFEGVEDKKNHHSPNFSISCIFVTAPSGFPPPETFLFPSDRLRPTPVFDYRDWILLTYFNQRMVSTQHFFLVLLFTGLSFAAYAQPQDPMAAEVPYWITAMKEPHARYQEAVASFVDFWKDKELPEEGFEEDKEKWITENEDDFKSKPESKISDELAFQYRCFLRWSTLHKAFLRIDGTTMSDDDLTNMQHQSSSLRHQTITADWNPTGPNSALLSSPQQMSRMGRTCQITFHPHDPQKQYVITGSGGLFVSDNNGQNWRSTNTDQFPFTHQPSCICIDHTDDQVLYLGMGDTNYASQGHGVRKSTDGGLSWTNINGAIGDALVYEIVMSPLDHNTLLVAAADGIWKSTDAGDSWQLRQSLPGDDCMDLKFKPGSADTLYACTYSKFYRSVDGGDHWQQITAGIELPAAGGRGMRLAVSAANPEIVYLGMISWHGTVFKSTDGGTTFNMVYRDTVTQSLVTYSGLPNDNSNGNYNFAMTADPWNADIVYFGTQTLWKSTDGGMSFQSLYHYLYVVHPDIHDLEFSPLDHTLFNCNDGGIAVSNDGGQNWQQRNDGIVAAEIYNGGQSPIRRDMLIIGTQDNGALSFVKNKWTPLQHGDIYDQFWFDYHTPDKYYSDRGSSAGLESHKNYSLNFPLTILGNRKFVFTPADSNIAFLCQNETWRSTNINSSFPSWTRITEPVSSGSSDYIRDMVVSYTNADELYVLLPGPKLLHSINALSANPTFDTLEVPASTFGNSALALVKYDPDIVYYSANQHLFRSEDKGNHWIDITGNLPGANIEKIIPDDYSEDGSLYVLCANRVYYRNDSIMEWVDYSQGLPALAYVSNLLLFNDGSRRSLLRVVTYGRGIFETPLYKPNPLPSVDFAADTNVVCTHKPVTFSNASLDGMAWHWEFEGGSPGVYDGQIPPPIYYDMPGIYRVSLSVSNANGVVTLEKKNYIEAKYHFQLPYAEGFEFDFPPAHVELKSLASSNVNWHIGYLGGFSTSTRCAVFNDAYNPTISDMRFNMDLSSTVAAELSFDLAYARVNGNLEFDSLEILVSVDCGTTFTSVYRKGGSTLATMPDIDNVISINPGPDDWRTETIDLAPFCGHENVFVYFRGWGATGEIILVDNITISDPLSQTFDPSPNKAWFTIVPNPSTGAFILEGIGADEFKVSVSAMTGEQIYFHTYHGMTGPVQINLANRPKGIYLLTVTIGEFATTQAVTLQ